VTEASRRVYLALGSNLGDREAHLREALSGLAAGGVAVEAVSSLYETAPWGVEGQPWYLNAALRGRSSLGARDLLALAKRLEVAAGRDLRAPRWSPRPLDVDIALIEGESVADEDLTVPHPLLDQRAFVLVPLAEVAGDVVHPVRGFTIAGLRDLRPPAERASVRLVRGPEWAEGAAPQPRAR
jgi:2-amino-4-hydroxy-6-hydroxymethyldihydropteridine diphosphokinase